MIPGGERAGEVEIIERTDVVFLCIHLGGGGGEGDTDLSS